MADATILPSARVLDGMRRLENSSHVRFVAAQSLQHRDAVRSTPLPAEVEARFQALTEQSLAEQRSMEAADDLSFEEYRQKYLAQKLL